MKVRNDSAFNQKREQIMQACFDCFSENGLYGTGISSVAKHAGIPKSTLYVYFSNIDELITQSTEYCMSKIEGDFMAKSPESLDDIERFIDEVPYWTAKQHGKKYRLMYQVYTHPKYIEYGKKFFSGVNERYKTYAKELEPKVHIPSDIMTPLIFIFIRACVHYALFEDEFYLKSQLGLLKKAIGFLKQSIK